MTTSPNTSIAATLWDRRNSILRVYTQELNGDIRESMWDGKSWSLNENVVARAKPNSPIAAIAGSEGTSVYYLTAENVIHEAYQYGTYLNWNPGIFQDLNIQTSTNSRLAAVPEVGRGATGHGMGTVFFQRPDGDLAFVRVLDTENRSRGTITNQVAPGSGLAASNFRGEDAEGFYTGIRVYYQRPDGTLADAGADREMQNYAAGTLSIKDARMHTSLSAFSIGPPPGSNESNPLIGFQLWYINDSDQVSQNGYYDSAWHVEHNPGAVVVRPGSGLSALFLATKVIRFYVQDETGQIVEYSSINDSWLQYEKGSVIPTSA